MNIDKYSSSDTANTLEISKQAEGNNTKNNSETVNKVAITPKLSESTANNEIKNKRSISQLALSPIEQKLTTEEDSNLSFLEKIIKIKNQLTDFMALSKYEPEKLKILIHIAEVFYTDLSSYLEISAIDATKLSAGHLPRVQTTRSDDSFFKLFSIRMNNLFKQAKKENLDITDAIVYIKYQIVNILLIAENKNLYFCLELLDSAIVYYNVTYQLGNFLGLSSANKDAYINNVYKMFIEGNILYSNTADYQADTNDVGAFIFDNEWRYSSRCAIALAMTIEKLVINKEVLTIDILSNIASVFSCTLATDDEKVEYGVYYSPTKNGNLELLLQQGMISKTVTYSSIYNVPDEYRGKTAFLRNLQISASLDKTTLEDAINEKLPKSTNIKLEEANKNHYFIKEIIKEGISTPVLIEAPLKFSLSNIDKKDLAITIKYDSSKYDRKQYALKIISIFHQESQLAKNNAEYMLAIVKLCDSIYKMHFFIDANGRSAFFILLPALLMQRGLWLTRQPTELLNIIEFVEQEKIAKIFLDLCIEAPEINSDFNNHWAEALPLDEKVRIACATGNMSIIKNILDKSPLLMQKPVTTTRKDIKQNPLDIIAKYEKQ